VAVLAFSNAAYVKHSFSDKQDTSAIQKALDDVTLDTFPANTVLAFNEAQRLLSCERKQRMRRVLVVASNGQYGCKKNYLILDVLRCYRSHSN